MLGPPRFLPSPLANVPWSKTPVGLLLLTLAEQKILPSTLTKISAPTTLAISRLPTLSTVRGHGYLCTTQDSLPVCWLGFDRTGFAPVRLDCPIFGELPPPLGAGFAWRATRALQIVSDRGEVKPPQVPRKRWHDHVAGMTTLQTPRISSRAHAFAFAR
jgi:hypothetical protein